MHENLNLQKGDKLRMGVEPPPGSQPDFRHICTFRQLLDDSFFLISAPLGEDRKPLPLDETQKWLFQYSDDAGDHILSGYADSVVKQGIRSFWKVRQVEAKRQFFQRNDVRVQVELPVLYMNPTWKPNYHGTITRLDADTLDISNNGLALQLGRWSEVGETYCVTLPHLGDEADGCEKLEVVGAVCWCREMPKGNKFPYATGLQLRFPEGDEDRIKMQNYVAYVQKRFKV